VALKWRFAFPFSCSFFALVAVPLGAQARRGGRAAGTLLAVILIACYYLLFVFGAGLARQGTLPAAGGVWIANIFLGLLGAILLPRMEQLRGDRAWITSMIRWMS